MAPIDLWSWPVELTQSVAHSFTKDLDQQERDVLIDVLNATEEWRPSERNHPIDIKSLWSGPVPLTPELAQTLTKDLAQQEKNILRNTLYSTAQLNNIEGNIEEITKITYDDLKMVFFWNPYWDMHIGEEWMSNYRNNMYVPMHTDKAQSWKLNIDKSFQNSSTKNFYIISFPTQEYTGRSGGQAGIWIELNKNYQINPSKVQEILNMIYKGFLINEKILEPIYFSKEARSKNPELPYFKWISNDRNRLKEVLNDKKVLIDWLNKEIWAIQKSEK